MPLPGQTTTNGKSHHYSTRVSLPTHQLIARLCTLTGWTVRQVLDNYLPAAEDTRTGVPNVQEALALAVENAAVENNARKRNLALTRIVKARKAHRHEAAQPKTKARKARPKAHAPKRNQRSGRKALARRRNAA